MEFIPPRLIRSPHLQTLLSSRLVRGGDGVGEALISRAETVTLACRHGVRLQAVLNPPDHAPGDGSAVPWILLIHGWLGRADSPYVRRASASLHAAGFGVARLLLRDHGDTAHLNEALFNAARIDEVVDAANALAERSTETATTWGLIGFSLGGNFVLRLAAHGELSPRFQRALAVCPVLDPAEAVTELDRGWFAYRQYFLGKWRRSLLAKQAAFPDRYDFSQALELTRVSTLTDYFVARHTEFRDAAEYYSHYTLGPDQFRALRMPTRILATEDDPVVPARHARSLQQVDAELVTLSRYGGHCGFIENMRLGSALDRYAVDYFAAAVGAAPPPAAATP